MALNPLEKQMAAEELLVLQYYLTSLAAKVTADLTALTAAGQNATATAINAAYIAYNTDRNAYADYGNVRLPTVVNTSIFTKIAAEAAA